MSNKIWYDYNLDDDLSKPSKVQATSSFISCNVSCECSDVEGQRRIEVHLNCQEVSS